MITLRKLNSLPPGTRLRKTVRLLQGAEAEIRESRQPDPEYFAGLLQFLLKEIDAGTLEQVAVDRAAAQGRAGRAAQPAAEGAPDSAAAGLTERVGTLREETRRVLDLLTGGGSQEALLRGFNALRHLLGALLGSEPGDWDLSPRAATGGAAVGGAHEGGTGADEPGAPGALRLFEMVLYLEDLRSPFNLGSIARSGEAFGAAGLLLSHAVPSVDQPRARRSAMGAFDRLPTARAGLPGGTDGAPPDGTLPVFALESGGTPIEEFSFPPRGVCLLGSEELGLSPEALALADRSCGRCTIPLYGAKGSLNVAVATGILLAYWTSALAGEERKGPAGDRRSLFSSIVGKWGQLSE